MDKCWANKYSQCSDQISREHIITDGVFEQQDIFVQGFPWCKNEEKKISVASATSKILCRKHNSSLSEIDKAGINAIRLFEETLPSEFKNIQSKPNSDVIDGFMFERWLLKIAVNVSFKSNFHIGIGMAESKIGKPSPYLLAVLFGDLKLSHHMGLYVLTSQYPIRSKVGEISIFPLLKDNDIGGYFFHIRGVHFFLSLLPGHSVPKFNSIGIQPNSFLTEELLNATPCYRLKTMDFYDIGCEKKQIKFNW